MTTLLQEIDVCNVRAYAAYAPSHPVIDASTRVTKQFKQRSCQSCTSSSASAWKAGTEASSVDHPALAVIKEHTRYAAYYEDWYSAQTLGRWWVCAHFALQSPGHCKTFMAPARI